jgi:Pregnancy-associated plasma protein-A/Secretion system C-terminal sorting domain/Fibronectin type III domain
MLKADPDMRERLNQIERHAQQFAQRNPSVSERAVINIPVVVHLIYNAAAENISDPQVVSQIEVLNKDFRKMNAEAASVPTGFLNLAADVEINFCLATVTPTGTATTGINRVSTTKTSWSSNDDMKRPLKGGVGAWDAARYLNIWVCNLGSGTLGYSSFPGATSTVDGVVIDYRYFGTIGTRAPFHLGRTTTHEVGHWLGLFHIWGDTACGDDHVGDTPFHHGANFGCPAYPAYNSSCGSNIIEMPMNFMDYTNDACMAMFTVGQKTRMRSLFVAGGARYSMVQANLCGQAPAPIVCAVPTNFSLSNITEASAKVSWTAVQGAGTYTLEYKPNYASVWTNVPNNTTNSVSLSNLLASTIYNVRVKTHCTNGGESAFSNVFSFVTNQKPVVVPVCSDNFEPNNTRTLAKPIATNRTEKAFISTPSDRDWYYFKADMGTNCTIRISNLPADYDLKLYDSKLRLLKSSENMGTSDEFFTFTAATTDSFLISVYGYNGAFDADRCYSLTVNTSAPTYNLAPKSQAGEINALQIFPVNRAENGSNTNGISRENRDGGVKIFPNPAFESVAIQIAPESESDAHITLTNLSGQIVLRTAQWVSKTANIVKVDLSTVPTGLYFVSVKQGTQLWTQKLVKK